MRDDAPQLRRRAGRVLRAFGFDLSATRRALSSIPRYVRDSVSYARASRSDEHFPFQASALFPCLSDYTAESGETRGHYFHQDLYMARKIFSRRPKAHVDIGSRIDGFVAHLLSFMPVTVVDIRPLQANVEGLEYVQGDATTLAEFVDDSVDSLSSLHAAEHFGLGRYGDKVAPDACFDFMRSMNRVLAPNGRLYFSVPVGRERVEFNAHRVFAPTTVLEVFAGLRLVSFSAVKDDGALYVDVPPESVAAAHEACGLFEFTK
jgi:hypothetical protein